jgi:protein-S-isoprenylcysteine O-methyltransferase Ste14
MTVTERTRQHQLVSLALCGLGIFGVVVVATWAADHGLPVPAVVVLAGVFLAAVLWTAWRDLGPRPRGNGDGR